ncbi:TonB-dependent receptor [Sphingomonas sp. NFR15]|uniref:TonB-dependent receptor n=1 Tax=Sphingomonas sp. NFR15 TaxID=1566282 RepID=UPI000886E333|nr:TonB-dependent receptor [Sphingomonas sp. NFR15]SDA36857.1 iron complex outermembrane recepter protein [Sphingomonas sp. NFR15]
MRSRRFTFLFLAGVSGLATAAHAADAPAAAAVESPAAEPEEITVTARHRVEKAQDVPIAITALSARDLAATGNFSIRAIQQQVPSLQILGFNPRNITIQIRGLGTTAGTVNSGIEPGVGVYVNGVYNARPSIAVFDVFDVASIDVLRGPQGTLFGKNSVAGVIDVHTNPASYTPEISGEASYGNYNFSQFKIAASAPLGDSGFAVRVAGMKSDRDGWIYNTRFKQGWQDYHNQAVRGELDYRNSDESFTARLIGDYNDQHEYSGFALTRGVLPKTRADGSVATARDFYARAADAGYTPLPIDPSAHRTDLNTPFTVVMNTGGVSLELDKKVLGGHTLTSITGWRFWNWNPSLDGDRIGAAVNTASNLPTYQRQWSEELRIASPSGGAVEYTAGLYYFWQSNREIPFNTYGADAAKYLLGAAYPSEALNNVSQTGLQLAHTASYSGFANATWHVTDRLAITAGARYTYEKRTGSYSSYQIGGTPLTDPVFARLTATQLSTIAARRASFAPTASYDVSAKAGRVSGTVNALYKLADGVNVYAGYSRGFKSAGINLVTPVQLANGPAPQTFRPETVDAYEIGLKSELIHNRLTLNLALFRSDDYDYQANQSVLVATATGPILRSYITNAGQVRTQGIEADLRATPIDGLTVSGGATYDDATFVRYVNGQCPYLEVTAASGGVCDLSGRPLTGVSKFVFNVSAEYARPVGTLFGGSTVAYIGGDYSHRSGAYGTLNDDPYGRIPGYGLAGLHLGIRDEGGKWDLKVWARNLFDTLYYVNTSVDSATTYSYAGSLGEPRFFGGSLAFKL